MNPVPRGIALLSIALALLATSACRGHETPGSADPPIATLHVGDHHPTPQHPLARTAEQIISAKITAAVLDWSAREIGPDDVASQSPGATVVVTFPAGHLTERAPGHLGFVGHGLEGFDTKTPVSFTAAADVTRGEMPGPFGGSVRLHYNDLEGTLDVDATAGAALLQDLDHEPLTTQFLVRVLGPSTAGDVEITDCELVGVRVLSRSRGEVLLEGTPAIALRG